MLKPLSTTTRCLAFRCLVGLPKPGAATGISRNRKSRPYHWMSGVWRGSYFVRQHLLPKAAHQMYLYGFMIPFCKHTRTSA